jgi:hypothetical protein
VSQPIRRLLPQNLYQRIAIGLPPQAPQGFQQRQIGLPSTIVLDALPTTDHHCRRGFHLRDKGVNQGGFANAGLTRDKDHLTLAVTSFSKALV